MHLEDLLSKATYSAFRLYIFCQYVFSLGIEPTTFCAANANSNNYMELHNDKWYFNHNLECELYNQIVLIGITLAFMSLPDSESCLWKTVLRAVWTSLLPDSLA